MGGRREEVSVLGSVLFMCVVSVGTSGLVPEIVFKRDLHQRVSASGVVV